MKEFIKICIIFSAYIVFFIGCNTYECDIEINNEVVETLEYENENFCDAAAICVEEHLDTITNDFYCVCYKSRRKDHYCGVGSFIYRNDF